MSGEFGTGKTIFVLAIVVGCFAVLWPKVFYPMLTASSISTTTKTSVPKTDSSGPRAERPAHLHPDMLHPALRERGRALPVRTIDKEAKPGPMPGVRPPMGGGAGHVAPSTNTKASSSMSIIMPLYTVGIIIFFIYTIMKVLFKKCPDDDDKTPKLKNFHMDPEYRKYIFEEEYLDSGDTGKDAFVKRAESREPLGLRRRHVQDQPERKIEDEQMDQLRRRLEDTERAMERLMAQMGTVSDKLTAAKITEVLSQAQTQAKLLKTPALPTTPTTRRCEVEVSSDKDERAESICQFSPVKEDEVDIEENETRAEVKGGELVNLTQLEEVKQKIENDQTPANGTDKKTHCEISRDKEDGLQLKSIAEYDEKLPRALTAPKMENTADFDLGRVINKPIVDMRTNLSPSPPSSLPAQKFSFHPKDSIVDIEPDGSDDDRSSDATETGADVSELRSFAEDVDASKLANEIISSTMLSKGFREFIPEAVMPKLNDASQQRGIPMLEVHQKSHIPEIIMPKFDDTPEVVMPKFDDTPEVVMPKFDDTPEVVMPKFDDTPEEVVMPKFDGTPEEVVMPKFDDTPEEVVMPKFDDTHESTNRTLSSAPQIVKNKITEALQSAIQKTEETSTGPERFQVSVAPTFLRMVDDAPEFLVPRVGDSLEVVIPEVDAGPELVLLNDENVSDLAMLKGNDFPELGKLDINDSLGHVPPKSDDGPALETPKIEDGPVLSTKIDCFTPNVKTSKEVVIPKEDYVSEVNDVQQTTMENANAPDAAVQIVNVQDNLIASNIKIAVPNNHDLPKTELSEIDSLPDTMLTKRDESDALIQNVNSSLDKHENTSEVMKPKSDAPQTFEPEVAGYSVFRNEILQIPSAVEAPKNWDAEEVVTSLSSGTPEIECFSNETTNEDLKNNQLQARSNLGTTPFDINISSSSTVQITAEVTKSNNESVETALNYNLMIDKSTSNKEKTAENLVSQSFDSMESSQRQNYEVVNIPNETDILKTFEYPILNQANQNALCQETLTDNFSFTDRNVHSPVENYETSMIPESMGTTDKRTTTDSKIQEPVEVFTVVSNTENSVTEDDVIDDRENYPIQESYELSNECDEKIPLNIENDTVCLKSPSIAVYASAFVTTEDTDESESSSHLYQTKSRNNSSLQHQPENKLYETTYSAWSKDVVPTLQEIEHPVMPIQDYEPKETVIKMALQPIEYDDELTDSECSEEKYAAVGTQTSLALDPPRMLRKKTAETSTQVEEGALSVLGFNTSWCVNDVCETLDPQPNIRDVTLDALLPSETQALVFQNKVGRAVSPNVEEDVSEIENSPYVITSQLSLNIIGLEHTNDSQNSKPAILFQAANPTNLTAQNRDDLNQSSSNSLNVVMNLPNTSSFHQPQLTNTKERTDIDINSPPTREIFIQSLTAGETLRNGRNTIVNVLDPQEIPRPKTPTPIWDEELILSTENKFETFKPAIPTSVNEVMSDTESTGLEGDTTPVSWSSNVLPYENSMFLASSSTKDTEIPMYFSCSVVHTPCSSIPQTPDQEAEIILASNAERTTYVVDEAASSLPDVSDSSVLGGTTSMLQNQATTVSSKGSSPDIQEYEVVQKDDSTAITADGRKTAAQN